MSNTKPLLKAIMSKKGRRLLIGATYKPAETTEETQRVAPTRTKSKKPEETKSTENYVEEKYNLVRIALQNTAEEAFEELEVPEIVTELLDDLTLNDQDLLWEFASMPEDGTHLQDFYDAIREEIMQRKIQSKNGLFDANDPPSYTSLIFVSPLLVEERKYEEERDGQLLRKDTPVRGVIKCERCGDNRISTRSVQTRSFDEPSTNFRTCYNCAFFWTD